MTPAALGTVIAGIDEQFEAVQEMFGLKEEDKRMSETYESVYPDFLRAAWVRLELDWRRGVTDAVRRVGTFPARLA